MTTYRQGTTQPLSALFFSAPGVPVAVSNLSLTVTSLADASVVLGPVTGPFSNPQLGAYIYQWAISVSLPIGQYLVSWSGDVAGDPINATEVITVVSQSNGMYSPGPCSTYPYISKCTIPLEAAPITGAALEAASEFLYYASAQRFDSCEVTIRPCRKSCTGMPWPSPATGWWEYGVGWGGGPRPVLYNGEWFNVICGWCGENCSCSRISETILPGPVQQIVEVKVDGEILINGIDYRLDDYRKLVRLGGAEWPRCNDLNLADTEVGTWSVTAIYGEPFPALGKMAMGEMFCEIIADWLEGDCDLPDSVTQLVRQGVTMTFENAQEALQSGLTGLKWVDRFIKTYNPHGLMGRGYAYDLDSPTFRVTDTEMM